MKSLFKKTAGFGGGDCSYHLRISHLVAVVLASRFIFLYVYVCVLPPYERWTNSESMVVGVWLTVFYIAGRMKKNGLAD